ncbi:hypothetical protein MKZ15_22175 [Paenibacillus sp. FSL R7-0216]|uniref:hypothetical protein n=1 Tax=Paenibacillus sp. FSL R7-0216 TaxID=2921677 RepID=UPI0030D8D342
MGTIGHSPAIDRLIAENMLDISGYDISVKICVSPWHWWTDVSPHRHDALSAALMLADPCPAPRRYKLKLTLAWEGGQLREYVSKWIFFTHGTMTRPRKTVGIGGKIASCTNRF